MKLGNSFKKNSYQNKNRIIKSNINKIIKKNEKSNSLSYCNGYTSYSL